MMLLCQAGRVIKSQTQTRRALCQYNFNNEKSFHMSLNWAPKSVLILWRLTQVERFEREMKFNWHYWITTHYRLVFLNFGCLEMLTSDGNEVWETSMKWKALIRNVFEILIAFGRLIRVMDLTVCTLVRPWTQADWPFKVESVDICYQALLVCRFLSFLMHLLFLYWRFSEDCSSWPLNSASHQTPSQSSNKSWHRQQSHKLNR